MTSPSEYGILFSGLAALLTAFGGISAWIFRISIKRHVKRVEEKIESTYQRAVVALTEANARRFQHIPPERTYSFDVSTPAGKTFCFPLFLLEWIEYIPGLHLMLATHDDEQSEVLLIATIDAHLPLHMHSEIEEIRVERGLMTDSQNGKAYMPGDVWTIPAGEPHSAWFQRGTRCSILLRPPLPTAAQRPIRTDGAHELF
jgi:hypothetical protein